MSLTQTILRSPAVAALTSPHGVDRYLEVVNPMWAVNETRARVIGVHRETEDVTTITLRPTSTWRGFRAGQHVLVGVEVDGARRTRCFSISSAQRSSAQRSGAQRSGRQGDRRDDFTITVRGHDEGLVSKHLARSARPGLVVHLSSAKGEFILPETLPGAMLMISGGSGITPLMSMLRTLVDQKYDGRVTFLHYAQSTEHTIFRHELADLAARDNLDVHVVHTREGGDRFTREHLARIAPDHLETDTFACGPAGLVEEIREVYGDSDRLKLEYFKISTFAANPTTSADGTLADEALATGTVAFEATGRRSENSGATLLEQAEALGLKPEFGCRMGICFTCVIRKHEGTVRNIVTGVESSLPDEDIQICVNKPVGDCAVAL